MARVCMLTGKRPHSGNNRPFSLKSTKRTFRPNLFRKRVLNPFTGRVERMRLSAKAIRTLKKWEREIMDELAKKMPPISASAPAEGEKVHHIKKEKLTPKQKKELRAQQETQKKTEAMPEVAKQMKKIEILEAKKATVKPMKKAVAKKGKK